MTTGPKTPAQHADDAAEAVRSLNHATLRRPVPGWEWPDEAYSTIGNLEILAVRLPQALGQVESLIGALEDAGRLRGDGGPDDLAQRLVDFHGAVGSAIQHAMSLRAALGLAHRALGDVGATDPDEGVVPAPQV